MIAKNLDDFINKVSFSITKAMNGEKGQKIAKQLRDRMLLDNPNLTPEQWKKAQAELVQCYFHMTLKENPDLMEELAMHIRKDLCA